MTGAQTEQQIRLRMAANEARYTRGRRRVLAALADADGPRSAAELHEDLRRNMPLSSLYRSLAVMAEAGVLSQHHGAKGITRYELAEWLRGHHHHLVCIECGSVDDVELPNGLESLLEGLVTEVAGSGGFSAIGHALEIEGRCAACA